MQTDERTVDDIFKAEGFRVIPAKTNTITARLAAPTKAACVSQCDPRGHQGRPNFQEMFSVPATGHQSPEPVVSGGFSGISK